MKNSHAENIPADVSSFVWVEPPVLIPSAEKVNNNNNTHGTINSMSGMFSIILAKEAGGITINNKLYIK